MPPKSKQQKREDDVLRRMLNTPPKPHKQSIVPATLFQMPFNHQFVREVEDLTRRALASEEADPELRRLKDAANTVLARANESATSSPDRMVNPKLAQEAERAWRALLTHIHQKKTGH